MGRQRKRIKPKQAGDLSFIVLIDDKRATTLWQRHLASRLRLREIKRKLGGFIKIERNTDYDPELPSDPDQDLMNFPWEIWCDVSTRTAREAEVMDLIDNLRAILEEISCRVTVFSPFEESEKPR